MKKATLNLLYLCLFSVLLMPSLSLADAVSQVNGKAEGVVASIDGDRSTPVTVS